MNEWIWRENVALAHAIVQGALALVFIRLLLAQVRLGGFRSLWADQISQGAIAFSLLFVGECLYRFWVWLVLRHFNDGDTSALTLSQWPFIVLSSCLVLAGSWCAIRVFSPDTWRYLGWAIAAVLAIAAVTLNILY